jgi:hypothetical protein
MRCFDETWSHSEGEVTFELGDRTSAQITVSGQDQVNVYGLRSGKEVFLYAGQAFKKALTVEGFSDLVLMSEKPFGYRVTLKERPRYEELNDLDPPPPPMRKTNLLQQIRESVLGIQPQLPRTSTMETELEAWQDRYAVDDEDYAFEEELNAIQTEPTQSQQIPEQEAEPLDSDATSSAGGTNSESELPNP